MSLFRKEVLSENNEKYYGIISLSTEWVYWLLGLVVVAFILSIVTTFTYSTYTKRANLQGYLIPINGITRIHSNLLGRVQSVLVWEGQTVQKGDPLIRVLDERQNLSGFESYHALEVQVQLRLSNLRSTQAQQVALFSQTQSGLNLRVSAQRRELQQLLQETAVQQQRLNLAKTSEKRYQDLAEQQFVSHSNVQEKTEIVMENVARLQALERAQTIAQRDIDTVLVELASLPMREKTQLAELERGIQTAQQELIELQSRREQMVVAPHAGVISGLTAKLGQLVSVDKPLLTLVPLNSDLEGHLFASSKDVGFVRVGQRVFVRYKAFPYQKFGHYTAQVLEVSNTPLMPTELLYPIAPKSDTSTLLPSVGGESLFRIRIRLDRQTANAYGLEQSLQAGLQLEGDVMLDTRTLFEWVLEPLYSLRGKNF